MRGGARLGWRLAVPVAFGATVALAVVLSRGAPTAALALQNGPGPRLTTATPRCAVSELRISVGQAARVTTVVTRYALDFTNTSGAPCTLAGYPEVAAYSGDDVQIGQLAAHDTSVAAGRVLLAPGETAHTSLNASVATGRCRPVRAAGLRVMIWPGQKAVSYVRRPLLACAGPAGTGQEYLRVRAIQPGASARTALPGSHPFPGKTGAALLTELVTGKWGS
jgi:hypothetical protein